jgi:single-strand DNA-binding protein
MAGVNRVVLVGYLAHDPATRTGEDGRMQASFTLGVTEKKNGPTEWFRVRAFTEGAAKALRDYGRKGMQLYVEGKLRGVSWTDAKGVKRYAQEIHVGPFDGAVTFTQSTRGGASAARRENEPPEEADNNAGTEGMWDDVPF